MTFPDVPMPDRVAERIGKQIPERVLEAEKAATEAAASLTLCIGPRYRDAVAYNLQSLARANKVLAAYNPGLIVQFGGVS
ncbi:hypothetical protein [Streptomyces alboflavus]|nr:hypothetical protein [Streptomyces alboflavus]